MTKRPGIVVIGGGISGLAAAHRIVELAGRRGPLPSLTLLEASDRLGGQIRTRRIGDALLEEGPDSIVSRKQAGVSLCRRLGLEDELVHAETTSTGSQVVRRGRRIDLPEGLALLAPTKIGPLLRSPLLSWSGKARMIAERYIPRPAGEQMEDESIEAFVVRRFGKQAYRRIAEPVLGGLYTGDTQTMSLELAMPRFRDLERRFGSVTRGLAASTKGCPVGGSAVEGFFTLRGGLESLVERLAARLPAGTVRLGQGVRRVAFDPGHGLWAVETEDETLPALAVILACPSHRAAAVVRELDPELAAWFDEFEYASCATVNLIYRRADVGAGLDRFGFFVPRGEKLPILGASVVSAKFPGRVHEDHVLVRTFMGGALAPQLLARDDAELIALSDGALRKLLSITDAPVETRVHRLPRSMPQFQVGAAARLGVIHDRIAAHRGLYLCGTAGGVIGLPDCIRSGETVAQTALEAVGPHALAETERNLPAAHLR